MMDLNIEPGFYPFNNGFDFSFGLGEPLPEKYGKYQARLVDYYYTQEEDANGKFIRKRTKTPIELIECGNENFNYRDQEEVTKYGINKFMCFKDHNYSLQGDFYSRYFKYIELRLYKCINSTSFNSCASNEEISDYFKIRKFSVAFVNSYFDFNDFENPIKTFIDDSLFWDIDTRVIKLANLYV